MKTFKEYLEENNVKSINTPRKQQHDGINARKLVLHKRMADGALKKAKGESGGYTHTKDGDIKPVGQVRDFKTGKPLPSHNPHVSSKEYMTMHRLHKKAVEAHQKHGPESEHFKKLDRVAYKYSNKLMRKEFGSSPGSKR